MAIRFDQCLHDLRHTSDVSSLVPILDHYLNDKGITSFLFYDPARPLANGAIIRNFDAQLVERFDSSNVWQLDPLRLAARSRPLVWHADEGYSVLTEAEKLVWAPMAEAGFRQLIAVPMHGPRGCDVFSVVTEEKSDCLRANDVFLNELILVAYHLAASLRHHSNAAVRPDITARELESLRLTAAGKTARQAGWVMGVTERTVNFHLGNAMTKLGAQSKYQAAQRAARLGLFAVE